MTAGTLISVEEYLTRSYSPDREFLEGMVVERNVGHRAHALLQARIIDPNTLESELRTAAGRGEVREKTLGLADSPIVVPLAEVLAE